MKLLNFFTLFISGCLLSTQVQAQDIAPQTEPTRSKLSAASNPLTPYADAYASLGFPWLSITADLKCSHSKPSLLTRTSYSVGRMEANRVYVENDRAAVECTCKLFTHGCEWDAVSTPEIPCPYGQANITGPNGEPAGPCPNEAHLFQEELIGEVTLWLDIAKLYRELEINLEDHEDLRSLSYEVCERWCNKAAEYAPQRESEALLRCTETPPTIHYAQYYCPTAPSPWPPDFHAMFAR